MVRMISFLLILVLSSCITGSEDQQSPSPSQQNAVEVEDLEENEILGENAAFPEENKQQDHVNSEENFVQQQQDSENSYPGENNLDYNQNSQSQYAQQTDNVDYGSENLDDAAAVEKIDPIDQQIAMPSSSYLWWVGFDSREQEGHVRVEVVVKGHVEYDIFQEINLSEQPEIVLRLYQTKPRKKLLRDLDASEFRSPVAWLRVREVGNFVDIVMTMRDEVKPKLFSEDGKFLFMFPIPDRYYGNKSIGKFAASEAELLQDADIFPVILDGSQIPRSLPKVVHAEENALENVSEENFEDVNLNNPPDTPHDFNERVQSYNQNEQNNNTQNQGYNQSENFNEEASQNNQSQNQDQYDQENADNEEEYNDQDVNASILWSSSAWSVAQDNLFDEDYDNNYQQQNQGFEQSSQQNSYEEDDGDLSKENNYAENNQDINNNDTKPESADEVMGEEQGVEVNPASSSPSDENVMVGDISNDLRGQDSENVPEEKPVALKKMVNLDFRNSNLQDVIRTLSEESQMNFLFAQDVQDIVVNIRLKNVTFEDALDSILRTYSLASTQLAPNVFRIVRIQNLAQEKRTLVESQRDHIALIPTKILVARLSYTKAPDIVSMVQEILTGSGDTRVRVQADRRTNSLIVEAIPAELSKVKALIERLDLKIPQVRISSRVIEVLNDQSKSMGINWTSPLAHDGLPGLAGGSLPIPKRLASTFAIDAGQTTTGNGRINLLLGNINSAMEMRLGLSLSENKGFTKQIQNSSVVVMDSETAKISAVKTDYIRLAEALEEIAYTVELEVTPQITAEGSVLLDVKITAADPSASNADGEQNSRNERSLETHLLKRSGETAVIGGLYTSSSIQGYAGVPFFSKIPIVGSLFRSNQETEDRRDLVVMITPEIVGGENNEEFSVVESGNPLSENNENYENPANFGEGSFEDPEDVDIPDQAGAQLQQAQYQSQEDGQYQQQNQSQNQKQNQENAENQQYQQQGQENVQYQQQS